MFYATDHSKVHGGPLPAGSSFRPEDWEILAGFWHPVAFEADIGDKPVAQRLLDVDLVIYRSAEGISVAKDLCMHRGTKMSGGWISDGRIVCPMHGLEYDGSGRCRRIPSIEDPNARIPDKLRLEVYQSEVRYGIVWACLREEPLWPLPSWPHLDGGEMAPIHIDGGTWYASASRHVENFNDVSHFPWVHGATFGGEMDASFPLYEVSETVPRNASEFLGDLRPDEELPPSPAKAAGFQPGDMIVSVDGREVEGKIWHRSFDDRPHNVPERR